MTLTLTPLNVLAGLGVLLAVFLVWRGSLRRARAAADAARAGARVVSLAGRVVLTAAVIVGVQWIVIRYAITNVTLLLVAHDGEWTRRRVGSPQVIRQVAKQLQLPVYDVQIVGYPERMRAYNARLKASRSERLLGDQTAPPVRTSRPPGRTPRPPREGPR